MDRWLGAALDYVPKWIGHQMRIFELPGCAMAVAHRGRIVLEAAFGHADLVRGIALTPRHRHRVASHSKSFTAAGIMKLREKGKLTLDDRAGRYVRDLHPAVAATTVSQLLSHSAGLVRDGVDAGQWQHRRPFLDVRALKTDLAEPPTIDADTRFKYSNHGYGLLGLIIEALTGEGYRAWIKREIVDAAGLTETLPDAPVPRRVPFARGHTGKLPLGERRVIPGETPTNALASATGFVSTAGDLVRFFAQLSPDARGGILSAASRRDMIRRQWRCPHPVLEWYYGHGVIMGALGGWDWFGHTGRFSGYASRTATLPEPGVTISAITNATDGLADFWVEGVSYILRRFAADGAPPRRLAAWSGRWWSHWGPLDAVPVGDKVLMANPAFFNPFMDTIEIEVTGRARGRIVQANGFANYGEGARLVRGKTGRARALQLGGARLLPEAVLAREISQRFGKMRPKRRALRRRG
ncbi:MAG TPA: serine hydrolase domain-containing protein [Stellaceae bacterium]|nr:serine hydrolase domain-containing protein [Stellaceae bacterium]